MLSHYETIHNPIQCNTMRFVDNAVIRGRIHVEEWGVGGDEYKTVDPQVSYVNPIRTTT